ncbi:MAG: hypothetical protein NC040_08485 [Muribaculaceae bacterium]|nr:hypothetical protein [Alistipes senegalensis]MCM1474083.1 hypothetical protein [Muribaculaceae bacterium]
MKNKGIIIELTSLLDVILIMLFWLMMNLQEQNRNISAEAETRIEQAAETVAEAEKITAESLAELEKIKSEMEELRESTNDEITEAWKKAASINDTAAANLLALENFEQGAFIIIDLCYSDSGNVIISDSNSIIGETDILSYTNISQELIYSLESYGFNNDNTIICAVTYNGSQALYKDVKAIRMAVDEVKKSYPDFYCTYLNNNER